MFENGQIPPSNGHNKICKLPPGEQHYYEDLPDEVVPNDFRSNSWWAPRMDPVFHSVAPVVSTFGCHHNFYDYIQQLPAWVHSYLVNVKMILSVAQVIQYFQGGEIVYATDGSTKDNIGSYFNVLTFFLSKKKCSLKRDDH